MLRLGRILNRVLKRQGDASLARIIPGCVQKRNMSEKKSLGEIKQEKGRDFLDNMDAAMVEKKARMEAWIEEMRHCNNMVPKVIDEYNWKIILTEVNSRAALEKLCQFMYRRECTKENDEAKREKRQKEREDKLHETVGSGHQFSLPNQKRDENVQMWARLRGIRYGDPIIMDMGYPELKFREMNQAYSQFLLVIGENKNHPQPFHIHVTSVNDNKVFADNFDSKDCQNMMVDFHEKPFWEIFPKEDLVYLTPDGPKLRGVNRNDIFVIGGVIDLHDSLPRSYIRAKELGIRMGSIPIRDYKLLVKGQGRRLTLPHIFGIMQDYCLNHDWEQALTKYLPPRHFLPKTAEGFREKIEWITSSKHPQIKEIRKYERELLDLKVGGEISRGKSMAQSVDVKCKYSRSNSDGSDGVGRSGRLAGSGTRLNTFGKDSTKQSDNGFGSDRNGKEFGDKRGFDEFRGKKVGIEKARGSMMTADVEGSSNDSYSESCYSDGSGQMTQKEFSKKKGLDFDRGDICRESTKDGVASVNAKYSTSKSDKSNDSYHSRQLNGSGKIGEIREIDFEESLGKKVGRESVRNGLVRVDEQDSANRSDRSDDKGSDKLSKTVNQVREFTEFDMKEFLGNKGLKEKSREGLMTGDLKDIASDSLKSDYSFDSGVLSGNTSGEKRELDFDNSGGKHVDRERTRDVVMSDDLKDSESNSVVSNYSENSGRLSDSGKKINKLDKKGLKTPKTPRANQKI